MPKNPNLSNEDNELYQRLLTEKEQANAPIELPSDKTQKDAFKAKFDADEFRRKFEANPEVAETASGKAPRGKDQEQGLEGDIWYNPVDAAAASAAGPLARAGEGAAAKIAALGRMRSPVGTYKLPANVEPLFAGGQTAAEQNVPLKDVVEKMFKHRDVKEALRQKEIEKYLRMKEPVPEYLTNPEVSPPSYNPDIGPEITGAEETRKAASNSRFKKLMGDNEDVV